MNRRTGGAKGFGRVFAETLCYAGAKVVITGRDGAALALAERDLRATGATVEALVADVTDRAAMAQVVRRTSDAYGGLDVLLRLAMSDDKGLCGRYLTVDDDV